HLDETRTNNNSVQNEVRKIEEKNILHKREHEQITSTRLSKKVLTTPNDTQNNKNRSSILDIVDNNITTPMQDFKLDEEMIDQKEAQLETLQSTKPPELNLMNSFIQSPILNENGNVACNDTDITNNILMRFTQQQNFLYHQQLIINKYKWHPSSNKLIYEFLEELEDQMKLYNFNEEQKLYTLLSCLE